MEKKRPRGKFQLSDGHKETENGQRKRNEKKTMRDLKAITPEKYSEQKKGK